MTYLNMFYKCSKLCFEFNFGVWCRAGKRAIPTLVNIMHKSKCTEYTNTSADRFDTYRLRILNYFRTNNRYKKNCISFQNISVNERPMEDTAEHLPSQETINAQCFNLSQKSLENNIYSLRLGDSQNKTLTNTLDAVCCARIHNISAQEILRLLDAWIHAFPNQITKTNFYKLVLQKMKSDSLKQCLSVEDAIQYLFYISLQKKSVSNIVRQLLHAIEQNKNLQSLTLEELCIIATGIFQSSTKLTSTELLLHLENSLQTHMSQLLNDTHLLIAIIKALRQARYYNYKVLSSLSANLLNNKSLLHYNFTVRTHIMIMYADSLYGREDVIKDIIAFNIRDISTKDNTVRAKDISSFLWAAGYLGVTIDKSVLEKVFVFEIISRIRGNEYRKNPSDIVDGALSLWMLGYKEKALFIEAVAPSIVYSLKGKMRFQSRLQLLMTCVAIEAPHFLQEEHKILMKKSDSLPGLNMKDELRKRPSLQRVYNAMRHLATILNLKRVECMGFIPHLNIGGVVVETNLGTVNIEVLDHTVCLYKSRQPHGVMQLKLRLLKEIGNELIIVNDEDDYTDNMETLMIFLEDAIKKSYAIR